MSAAFRAPFPYPGGKALAAPLVWSRFGDPRYYFEPFSGSCAVLLARPGWRPGTRWLETVNDVYGHVVNFWRSVQKHPDRVERAANQPPFENDFHAWHVRCLQVEDDLRARLEGDPDYCDPELAGRWAWGVSLSLGNCFMRYGGPWWPDAEGRLVRSDPMRGIERSAPIIPHCGIVRAKPKIENVSIGDLQLLAERFSFVRVLCGDWRRAMPIPSLLGRNDVAIFLDPPYGADRDMRVYSRNDSADIAAEVREWCKDWGRQGGMRIALCGLDTEHDELLEYGWTKAEWVALSGWRAFSDVEEGEGIDSANPNRLLERIWFSPGCSSVKQLQLF